MPLQVPRSARTAGRSADNVYEIQRSLRFRGTNSYLTRTPATLGNQTTWTFSAWVKRSALGAAQGIFWGGSSSGGSGAGFSTGLVFNSSDQLAVYWANSGGAQGASTAVFRDTTSFYHIMCSVTGGRFQAWVNNKLVLSLTVSGSAAVGNTVAHYVGAIDAVPSWPLGGYICDAYYIDGQALTPTLFGYSDIYGGWHPKKYSGTYGVTGFYLPFDVGTSATTLSQDRSGLGNDLTAFNISTVFDATYDWTLDTPSNNYLNLNQLQPYVAGAGVTLSDGGLKVSHTYSPTASIQRLTPPLSTLNKCYFELSVVSGAYYSGGSFGFGLMTPNGGGSYTFFLEYADPSTMRLYVNGSYTAQATLTNAVTASHTTGWAIDNTTGVVYLYIDNTLAWTSATLTNLSTSCFTTLVSGNGGTQVFTVNFGQQPFKYTPPAGFKPICSKNFPLITR